MKRRALSLFVGVFAMLAVTFFIFQANLATILDTWLIGIVAWVAAWGGIMLVHYFRFERGAIDADKLFAPVGSGRIPDVNGATLASFGIGVVATWLFMYGLTPALQGFAARAMGGVDLSWLAGGLAAAGSYAVLGRRAHARYAGRVGGVTDVQVGGRPGGASPGPATVVPGAAVEAQP